jgi:hypothetical protein
MDEPACPWETEAETVTRTPTVAHGEREVGNAANAVREFELDSDTMGVGNDIPTEFATPIMDDCVARNFARRCDQHGAPDRRELLGMITACGTNARGERF